VKVREEGEEGREGRKKNSKNTPLVNSCLRPCCQLCISVQLSGSFALPKTPKVSARGGSSVSRPTIYPVKYFWIMLLTFTLPVGFLEGVR